MSGGNWFVDLKTRDLSCRVRVFCFPFAGGGVSSFKKWQQYIAPDAHLSVLALPGREARIKEAPVKDINVLIKHLTRAITDRLDTPYVFFGHSMGAIIAYELMCELDKIGAPSAKGLIVSARGVESKVKGGLAALKELESGQLDKLALSLQGKASQSLIGQLKKLTTSWLEQDFALCSTLAQISSKVLDVPIFALSGTEDRYANSVNMMDWQAKTAGEFVLKEISGDHFFMIDNAEDTCNSINAILSERLQ